MQIKADTLKLGAATVLTYSPNVALRSPEGRNIRGKTGEGRTWRSAPGRLEIRLDPEDECSNELVYLSSPSDVTVGGKTYSSVESIECRGTDIFLNAADRRTPVSDEPPERRIILPQPRPRLPQLEDEVQEAQDMLARIKALQDEIETLCPEGIEALEKQKAQAEDTCAQIKALQAEIQATGTDIEPLKEKHERQKAKLEAVQTMIEDSDDALFKGVSGVLGRLGKLMDQDTARLNGELAEAVQDLERKDEDRKRIESAVNQKSNEYREVDKKILRLRNQSDAYDRQIEEHHQALDALDESIRKTEAEEKRLQEEIEAKSAVLERVEMEVRNRNNEISDLEQAIGEQPEQARQLEKQQTELEERLKRIRSAVEEFTPEKQAQLQKTIREEEDALQKNQKSTEALRQTLEGVQSARAEVRDEEERLVQNVLERVEEALNTLGKSIGVHAQRLNGMREMADAYARQVKECEALRKQYADCWEMDDRLVSQVRAVLKTGDPVNEELRKALNVKEDERIAQLDAVMKDALGEMDEILKGFNGAMARDYAAIKKRVNN